jgi:hypothetical protein
MGIPRSIGKGVGGFFFTTFLTFLILIFSVIELTEYDSLKSIAADLISEATKTQLNVTESELVQLHSQLIKYCEIEKEEIQFPLGNENITLKCSEVNATKPKDLFKLMSSAIFDKIYYKKYDCEFIQCLKEVKNKKENLAVLLSAKAHNFFKNTLNYLYVGTAISGVILAVSSMGLTGMLKSFGFSFLTVGIPFFLLPIIQKVLPISVGAFAITPAIDQIFGNISTKFLVIFILGLVLAIVGYGIEYLKRKKKQKKK